MCKALPPFGRRLLYVDLIGQSAGKVGLRLLDIRSILHNFPS